MKNTKYVCYLRVSTLKQGISGLGIEAQRNAVSEYLGNTSVSIKEFVEIETGKGTNALDKRPVLKEALTYCKRNSATLLIAKLDRLARNVHFVSGLLETGVDFIACDMPNANKTMIQMFSVMAEWERDAISARTKAALMAAKHRGVRLGTAGAINLQPNLRARKTAADDFALSMKPLLDGLKAQSISQRRQIEILNQLRTPTANGITGNWTTKQLQRIYGRLQRLDMAS